MTALLLFEAIDTAGVLLDAILAWIIAAAFVVTVVVYTLVLTGAWAWRAVRRGHTPASEPHGCACGSRVADSTPRPADARVRPSWARTEHDHQEAA